ncbi:MAG: hypothetical protein QOF02_1655 [Blastocatellia bacterium]|jgi:hypothetical protein|nr:hypothetical protein [Blastocatellia bacterium]
MIERLTKPAEVEEAARRIAETLAAHAEWLYAEGASRRASSLRRSECDVRAAQGRLIFSCWSDEGARVWRVKGWEWTGEKLLLEATRAAGAESVLLELIPRAAASAVVEIVSASRRLRAEQLARLACAQLPGARVERVGLSSGARRGQPGRYARIMLTHRNRRIAVTGLIAAAAHDETEAFLSSALLWFTRARQQRRGPLVEQLWLVVHQELAQPVARQLALLRDDLCRALKLFSIDEQQKTMTPLRSLDRAELWDESLPRFRPPALESDLSDWAKRLLALAPEAVDVVRARHGETLRFHGLAFARVRRLLNQERAWLGIDGARRRLLDASNWHECVELLEQLRQHRDALAADHRHAFYKAAPEAWLESMLRRDITQLDPGLRIAPLHAQFRAARTNNPATPNSAATRPVDLLALRHDGRLVVIELKVAEDREHVLQGTDYYRRVEAHRRRGHLAHAKLFGDAHIADSPPLVYLVAPLLRFHRAFNQLALSIAPDIELYRFDLNEDWRAGIRVVRRARVNYQTP